MMMMMMIGALYLINIQSVLNTCQIVGIHTHCYVPFRLVGLLGGFTQVKYGILHLLQGISSYKPNLRVS